MPIPQEAGYLEEFTPPSLANIPVPPVFLLRPATRRDRDMYQKTLLAEGLQRHSADRIREESLTGLKALWDAAAFEQNVGRIRAYWEAVDHFIQRVRAGEKDAALDFPADEAKAVEDLLQRVSDSWPPLRQLGADNVMFQAKAPEVMLSILVAGWIGIDLPYARAGGVVPLDLVEKLDEKLTALERKHADVEGIGTPGTALTELGAKAGQMLFLSEDEEKNSESPPPSSQTPPASKTAGRASRSGRSKASARSAKTPSAS